MESASPESQERRPTPDSLSVLVGGGDSTFADAQTYPAGNTHTVAVVDLDGDGKLDLALVDSGTRGVVSILLGT